MTAPPKPARTKRAAPPMDMAESVEDFRAALRGGRPLKPFEAFMSALMWAIPRTEGEERDAMVTDARQAAREILAPALRRWRIPADHPLAVEFLALRLAVNHEEAEVPAKVHRRGPALADRDKTIVRVIDATCALNAKMSRSRAAELVWRRWSKDPDLSAFDRPGKPDAVVKADQRARKRNE